MVSYAVCPCTYVGTHLHCVCVTVTLYMTRYTWPGMVYHLPMVCVPTHGTSTPETDTRMSTSGIIIPTLTSYTLYTTIQGHTPCIWMCTYVGLNMYLFRTCYQPLITCSWVGTPVPHIDMMQSVYVCLDDSIDVFHYITTFTRAILWYSVWHVVRSFTLPVRCCTTS